MNRKVQRCARLSNYRTRIMAYSEQYIAQLILKHFKDEINPLEMEQLERWLLESPLHRLFFEGLNNEEDIIQLIEIGASDKENTTEQQLLQEIKKRIAEQDSTQERMVFYSNHITIRKWWYAAAAVAAIMVTAAFFWLQRTTTRQVESSFLSQKSVDVLPGSDRAVLTLSNGQQVQLNSSGNQVINDGELAIANTDGELVYAKSDKVVYNTMTTPKGGQYKLTLADGSKVWLNAASSITFPTQFIGSAREVNVTGEVYFEVNRNKKMPFIVKAPGGSNLEVLGTHFNVNVYSDETYQTTTLIEGLVRVHKRAEIAALKVGQQARITVEQDTDRIDVLEADVEEVMAWRNNLFVFNYAGIPEIMRQLSRWYDLDIQYKGTVPKTKFKGKIPRDFNLSQVLNALQLAGVNFEVDRKTLIVSQHKS